MIYHKSLRNQSNANDTFTAPGAKERPTTLAVMSILKEAEEAQTGLSLRADLVFARYAIRGTWANT
jgi:hypothetical protein